MKLVNTEEAVGHMLCHDITQIVKGKTKDAVFRKGHIVTEADIPVLLSVGKEHLYIWENTPNMIHENDAADILYKICCDDDVNFSGTDVKEGKIEVIAEIDGLLKINRDKLFAVNALGNMMIATRHENFPVKKGDHLAGTRIIPLIIDKAEMEAAKNVTKSEQILSILPYTTKKIGIITTGSEVFKGRIKDTFTPVIESKLAEYPKTEVVAHTVLGDDHEAITEAILDMIKQGANMVICTGGMSVDPDDKTPLAIKNTGANIVSYGAPVLPGAMFLLAYYGDNKIPVIGLPGCVMYAKRTIFDLMLPRILVDDNITEKDIAELGYGGLCLNCPVCTFPQCTFGRA